MFVSKIKDYSAFIKLRLTVIVIFSAATGYILGTDSFSWNQLSLLVLGGLFITGSSNGFNQIIERDFDKMMDRTAKRPLPDGRMGLTEAYILSISFGITGICILFFFINPLSSFLGLLALLLYTLVYTPLKRVTPIAVLVGAFPGSIPPMLGWVAATGEISMEAWILFAIQFIWQFPHFWAIAWVLDDDYKKAGFNMLPSPSGRSKSSAFQILIYTISLIPISLLPIMFKVSGSIAGAIILIMGIYFLIRAISLYNNRSIETAKKMMLTSFLYLPVVQIALMIDKL